MTLFRHPIIVLDTETAGLPEQPGAHRLEEAAALIDCRGMQLTVDQAEAVLIAGAALLLRGAWKRAWDAP